MINSAIVTCPKFNARVLPKPDGICPSCGAFLSSKEGNSGGKTDSTGNAAPSRTGETIKKGARKDGLQTQGPEDGRKIRIRLAIEGAVRPYAFADVAVGDLLFVDSDVYFVSYCAPVTLSGGISLGGLVGGLAGLAADKGHLEDARQAAAGARKENYGLSLDERVKQLYQSVVIRNPARVAFDAKASSITCTSNTGEKTTFFVPQITPAARALLADFPEGEDSLYPAEDPYGLLIWASSPKALTETLIQGQIDAAFLDRVASDQQYMLSFYRQVRLMPAEQQGVLIENLRHTPARFRASLSLTAADTQKNDALARKNTVKIGVMLGFILLAISLPFLASKSYVGLGIVVLLGLASLMGIPYWANRTARGQERLMQAILDAIGRGKQA